MEVKNKILLIIFAICLISSSILAFMPVNKICGDQVSSCSIVQHSKYESTLGINNSYFGVIAFTLLIFLLISNSRKPEDYKKLILNIVITASAIAAIYFIYLQLFIIKAICPYCMIVDTGAIAALAIILVTRKNEN